MKQEWEVQAQLCSVGTAEKNNFGLPGVFLPVPKCHSLTWSHFLKIVGFIHHQKTVNMAAGAQRVFSFNIDQATCP